MRTRCCSVGSLLLDSVFLPNVGAWCRLDSEQRGVCNVQWLEVGLIARMKQDWLGLCFFVLSLLLLRLGLGGVLAGWLE